MYRPRAKHLPRNWALWLVDDDEPKENTILQLEDRPGMSRLFVADPILKNPGRSDKLWNTISLRPVAKENRQEAIDLMQSNRVRRRDLWLLDWIPLWNTVFQNIILPRYRDVTRSIFLGTMD